MLNNSNYLEAAVFNITLYLPHLLQSFPLTTVNLSEL